MRILLIIMLLIPTICLAEPLQCLATKTALGYEGTREEHNRNDGPQIKQWQEYVAIKTATPKAAGDPYCVAFVVWDYHVAATRLATKDPLPRVGGSLYLLELTKKNPLKYKVITPNQVILKVYKLEEGDVSIHKRGLKTGHAGLILRQLTTQTYESIEANTQSSEAGDQGEGGGVFKKQRSLKSAGFPVIGIIRVIK